MSLEYCIACGEPTGRAGRGDDSLFRDNGSGPYCLECFETVERLNEENAALRARVGKLERVRVAVRDAADGSIDLTRCTVCEARMRGVDIKHEAYCIVGKVVAALAECEEARN